MFVTAEEVSHFLWRLQMALGIGGELKARLMDRAFFADAGENILQRAAVMMMIENIISGHERRVMSAGMSSEAIETVRTAADVIG